MSASDVAHLAHTLDVMTTIRASEKLPPAFEGPPDASSYGRVLEAATGIPATRGNDIAVLRNGDEIFPAMLDAIDGAERSVDFMSYVFWTGDIAERFADALADRAAADVRVRVLLDAFGTRPMEDRLVERIRRAGALVEVFRPFSSWKFWRWNMRTHRRVLVVDDEVGFTGGVGIGRQWTGDAEDPDSWRDTHFRVEGPAVDGIHAAFLSDWLEVPQPAFDDRDRFPERPEPGETRVQVVRAASQPGWNDAALALRAMLALAQDRLRITSPYFRPPDHFGSLLGAAVDRGVAVEVLVPGPHAEPALFQRAAQHHFESLLEQGVRIWSYQPTMHHTKSVTVDGVVSFVGTVNFDARSFAVNEQIGLIIHDEDVTAVLDGHFDEDREQSELVDPESWARRGWRQRVEETAAHVATFGTRGHGATRRSGPLA